MYCQFATNHKHLSLRRKVIPPRYFTCTFIKKAWKVVFFGGKYMVARVIWKIYANNVKKRKTWAPSAAVSPPKLVPWRICGLSRPYAPYKFNEALRIKYNFALFPSNQEDFCVSTDLSWNGGPIPGTFSALPGALLIISHLNLRHLTLQRIEQKREHEISHVSLG